MTEHIPSKETASRYSQPWINQDLKRSSRRKKKAYNKARSTKKKEDWAWYKKLKKDSQRECRRADSSYVNSLVSDNQSGNPKKLYSFIKSKKCDASGVAPLSSNGVSHSDSVKKANILNEQFTSVLTKEDLSSVPEVASSLMWWTGKGCWSYWEIPTHIRPQDLVPYQDAYQRPLLMKLWIFSAWFFRRH